MAKLAMKKTYKIFAIIFFSLVLFSGVLFIVFRIANNHNAVKEVNALPKGFISIEDISDLSTEPISYVFWESQISFFDMDNNCIYQSSVDDSDFIVRYLDEYYVNRNKIADVLQDSLARQKGS